MMNNNFKYRADIDGLRAIAILLVIIYHAFPQHFKGGFLGVDIFFVISGYLISGIILEELDQQKFSIINFYSRRIRRLFPSLITVMLGSFIAGWFLLLPNEYKQLNKHLLGGSTFISNFFLWNEAGYFDKAAEFKPLLHLWSLSIEEQFYFFWPIILSLLFIKRKYFLIWITVFTFLSFTFYIYLTIIHPITAFYLSLARFWELMIGAGVAYITLSQKHDRLLSSKFSPIYSLTGLLLIFGSVVLINQENQNLGWWNLLSTLGAALLIYGEKNWINNTFLSNRIIVWIGIISYPLYLWHWPLFSYFHISFPNNSSIIIRIILLLISISCAWLTYYFIERPIRYKAHKKNSTPFILCILLFIIGLLGLTGYFSQGYPFRFSKEILNYLNFAYDLGKDANPTTCWLNNESNFNNFAPSCYPSKKSSAQKDLLIWGDSHAARLYPGFIAQFSKQYNIAQYTRDSCPPVLQFQYPNCIKSNNFVMSVIKKRKPSIVVLSGVWNKYINNGSFKSSSLLTQLNRTITHLQQIGIKQIIIVGPAPQWTEDLPKVLYEFWHQDPLHRIPKRMKFKLDNTPSIVDKEMSISLNNSKIRYISLINILCNNKGCLTKTTSDFSSLTTPDYGHLTTAGALYVTQHIII